MMGHRVLILGVGVTKIPSFMLAQQQRKVEAAVAAAAVQFIQGPVLLGDLD